MWEIKGEMQEITLETKQGAGSLTFKEENVAGGACAGKRREGMDGGGENVRGGFSACPQTALKSH